MRLTAKFEEMKIGMIFEDNDPRGPKRYVRVVDFNGERVHYVRCSATGEVPGGRSYTAMLTSFFRGGSRGFSLFARPIYSPLPKFNQDKP